MIPVIEVGEVVSRLARRFRLVLPPQGLVPARLLGRVFRARGALEGLWFVRGLDGFAWRDDGLPARSPLTILARNATPGDLIDLLRYDALAREGVVHRDLKPANALSRETQEIPCPWDACSCPGSKHDLDAGFCQACGIDCVPFEHAYET